MTQKFVTVLVIDPEARTVTPHEWEHAKHSQLYDWIGTSMLDHVTLRLPDGRMVSCFVDDIGLHKPELVPWFLPMLYVYPLKGKGVMIGANNRGETIDVPWAASHVLMNIRWARPKRNQPPAEKKKDQHGEH